MLSSSYNLINHIMNDLDKTKWMFLRKLQRSINLEPLHFNVHRNSQSTKYYKHDTHHHTFFNKQSKNFKYQRPITFKKLILLIL